MSEEEFYSWKYYIAVSICNKSVWSAHDRKSLKVLAISPSNLTDHNKQDYAKRIVNVLYNPPVNKNLY